MGNHEYGGNDDSVADQQRFLKWTGMREVGDQGGLWGEYVVDGKLPVLWIASEEYKNNEGWGSGPFVEFSDAQFSWLSKRLDYWRSQNKPVLLFSHHLLPYSNSGSYGRFYEKDFGDDEARFAALLDRSPNVTMVTAHTHWPAQLNDWSADLRTDPSIAQAPTTVNTIAVTTMYGPKNDWAEGSVSGPPAGLRAALYDDRMRITAYAFTEDGPQEIKYVDIPLPTEAETPPPSPEPGGSGEPSPEPGGSGTPSPEPSGTGTEPGATPGGTGTEPGEPGGSSGATEAPSDAEVDEALANTGADATTWIVGGVGLVLLAAGGAILIWRRRAISS